MPSRLDTHIPRRKLRAGLYARVSRDLQDGRSTSQQVDILTHESTEAGEDIAGVYVDNDRSASQYARREREDWERLMEDIHAGKLDILRGWEIARLTREREVWAKLIRACQDQHMLIGIGGRVYDTRDASDMFYLDILVATAVKESGDTQRRINRDIEANARAGGVHGISGYGYTREYDPTSGRLLRQVPHPQQAAIIREVVGRLLEGSDTLYSICQDLNRRGVRTFKGHVAGEPILNDDGEPVLHPVTGLPRVAMGWSPPLLQDLLERKSLMGVRVHRGREYPGRWEPILDQQTWWAVQERIHGAPSQRETKIKYLLSGLAVCGVCGGRMYVVPRRSGNPAYQCRGLHGAASSGHVLRGVAILEEHVTSLLFERFSDPDVVEAFRAPPDAGAQQAQEAAARLEGELEELYAQVEADAISWRLAQARERHLTQELEAARQRAQTRVVDPLLVSLARPDREAVERQWGLWGLHQRRLALAAAVEPGGLRVLPVGRVGRRRLLAEESVEVRWAEARPG